jgi:hypothetical protein
LVQAVTVDELHHGCIGEDMLPKWMWMDMDRCGTPLRVFQLMVLPQLCMCMACLSENGPASSGRWVMLLIILQPCRSLLCCLGVVQSQDAAT